jgi:hypothetical protein
MAHNFAVNTRILIILKLCLVSNYSGCHEICGMIRLTWALQTRFLIDVCALVFVYIVCRVILTLIVMLYVQIIVNLIVTS